MGRREAPWGVASMPWIFIVDGDGIVRAKYQGVMGTADVDVHPVARCPGADG